MNTEQITDQRAEREIPPTVGEVCCGREVFAADEIRFEDALAVVGKRMGEIAAKVRAKGHQNVFITFRISALALRNDEFDFTIYDENPHWLTGRTLEEALAKVNPPRDLKSEKISKLRAELAQLESEAQS